MQSSPDTDTASSVSTQPTSGATPHHWWSSIPVWGWMVGGAVALLAIPTILMLGLFIIMFFIGVQQGVAELKNVPTENTVIEKYSPSPVLAVRDIALNTFYTDIHGNIGDYTVSIPANYVVNEHGRTTFWGAPEDMSTIKREDETTDLSVMKKPVFTLEFSDSTEFSKTPDGIKIVSSNGVITAQDYIKGGVKELKFESGYFHGFPSVPVIVATGKNDGKPMRMAYIASPVDNVVLLVYLRGGNPTEAQTIWSQFVQSLTIEPASQPLPNTESPSPKTPAPVTAKKNA